MYYYSCKGPIMRKLLYLLFLLPTLTGCDLITQYFSPSQTDVTSLITEFFSPSQTEVTSCELEKKYYPVQTARYENQSQIYQLTLLDTPICFKNPLTLSNVRLGRLSPEEKTEKAKLDYINAEDSTLYLSPGFPIEILSPKENGQTGGSSSGSSLWVPLVAGAAGAALGNLAASRLSSPQYVSPPTPNGTGSLLQGFDDRQVSKTPPPSKSSSSYKDVAQKKKKSYSSFQPNKSSRKFKSKRRR